MKRSTLSTAIGLAMGAASFGAHAALTSSAVLEFNPGVYVCNVSGTYPNCDNAGSNVGTGSYFGMDADGSGGITNTEKTAIAMHNGIHIGFTTTATGSHTGQPFGLLNSYTGTNYQQIQVNHDTSGNPIPVLLTDANTDTNGQPIIVGTQTVGTNTYNVYSTVGNLITFTTTEQPGVDEPWSFFGNTGMDYLTKAVTEIGAATGTTKELDFSGWTVTWNGIPTIPMTSGAWGNGTLFSNGGNGVARINCSVASCSQSSNFTLNYFATVPTNDPSGFGGVKYQLHLEGHIGTAAVVPVPAAAWLFGSGLMGMAAVARRKKKA